MDYWDESTRVAWLFLLKGERDVLVRFAQMRELPDWRVRFEAPGQLYLEIDGTRAETLEDAKAIAVAMLAKANQTLGLRSPTRGVHYAELGHRIEQELANGVRLATVQVPSFEYVAGESIVVSFGVDEVPVVQPLTSPSRLETLVERFVGDLVVERVIQYLFSRMNRPLNLYKVYELIGNDLRTHQLSRGRNPDLDPKYPAWIENGWSNWHTDEHGVRRYSDQEMIRFRKSVHSEQGMGPDARHALQEPLSVTPMSMDEGFDFLKGLVEQWLVWKSHLTNM